LDSACSARVPSYSSAPAVAVNHTRTSVVANAFWGGPSRVHAKFEIRFTAHQESRRPSRQKRRGCAELLDQGQIRTHMFFARALAVRSVVQASHPLASKRMQQRSWARGIFLPPGPPAEGSKIGFTTYAMWGLCAVVVGVCYVLEQNEAPSKSSSLPVDVQRVLPSGAYLMSARCALVQKPRAPTLLSMLTAPCESRGSCAQRMAACANRWLRSGRDGFEGMRPPVEAQTLGNPTASRSRERLQSNIYSLSGDLSCRTGSRSG
jgi:hypothetical protein